MRSSAIVGCVLLVACGGDPSPGDLCERDGDCATGAHCGADGRCQTTCDDDSDCPGGACDARGRCTGPTPDGGVPQDDAGGTPDCVEDLDDAESASDCCSGLLDAWGSCCRGMGCCADFNHSHVVGEQCMCDEGYEWATPAPDDFTCVLSPTAECEDQTACDGCASIAGCGYCQANGQCLSGTETGPSFAACASGWTWYPADCAGCTPDCSTRSCGDDGCGGSCGYCPSGQRCSGEGVCYVPEPECGADNFLVACGSAFCPLDSMCVDGTTCRCNDGYRATACDGRICDGDCAYPSYWCEPIPTPTGLGQCSRCAGDAECASGVCLTWADASFCSRRCTVDSDCFGGSPGRLYDCISGVCYPNNETGTTCTADRRGLEFRDTCGIWHPLRACADTDECQTITRYSTTPACYPRCSAVSGCSSSGGEATCCRYTWSTATNQCCGFCYTSSERWDSCI